MKKEAVLKEKNVENYREIYYYQYNLSAYKTIIKSIPRVC